ncbi:putative peptidoglycan endopeptidase LytE precursor [compost metagenome]
MNKLRPKFILLILLFISFSYCSQAQALRDSISADSLSAVCISLKGTPYKYGGISQNGFDCSGFVSFVFAKFGINVGHSSGAFGDMGERVAIEDAQIGDVIVFTGTNSKKRSPGHLGIVISMKDEELAFIHSSSAKKDSGVKITTYKTSNYPARFLEIRRIAIVQ